MYTENNETVTLDFEVSIVTIDKNTVKESNTVMT